MIGRRRPGGLSGKSRRKRRRVYSRLRASFPYNFTSFFPRHSHVHTVSPSFSILSLSFSLSCLRYILTFPRPRRSYLSLPGAFTATWFEPDLPLHCWDPPDICLACSLKFPWRCVNAKATFLSIGPIQLWNLRIFPHTFPVCHFSGCISTFSFTILFDTIKAIRQVKLSYAQIYVSEVWKHYENLYMLYRVSHNHQ